MRRVRPVTGSTSRSTSSTAPGDEPEARRPAQARAAAEADRRARRRGERTRRSSQSHSSFVYRRTSDGRARRARLRAGSICSKSIAAESGPARCETCWLRVQTRVPSAWRAPSAPRRGRDAELPALVRRQLDPLADELLDLGRKPEVVADDRRASPSAFLVDAGEAPARRRAWRKSGHRPRPTRRRQADAHERPDVRSERVRPRVGPSTPWAGLRPGPVKDEEHPVVEDVDEPASVSSPDMLRRSSRIPSDESAADRADPRARGSRQ